MEKRVVFRSDWLPWALLAPQMIVIIVFFFWPASQALMQSMQMQDAFGTSTEWVGLDNFKELFADPKYIASFETTALFSILVAFFGLTISLVLAVFADRGYPWVSPVVVVLMVALNAFYFTAMQNMGEQLTLAPDGFRLGAGRRPKAVRWIHVTEFTGARVGAFSGMKMPEADEWQDPRVRPNVILYRLNRALTPTHRSLVHRLIGFSYYDGTIRNAFGVPTPLLLRTLRDWQRIALDAESLPLRPA